MLGATALKVFAAKKNFLPRNMARHGKNSATITEVEKNKQTNKKQQLQQKCFHLNVPD